MCGIIGYIAHPENVLNSLSEEGAHRDLASILMVGLDRLSYRGYDSSGIAVLSEGEIDCWKRAGKLVELKKVVDNLTIRGNIGIGHTRWATHGDPTDVNAHPHVITNPNNDQKLALVHNGIIENYLYLRRKELNPDQVIVSSTDTEILGHLLMKNWQESDDLIEVGRKTFTRLEGSYAVSALFENHESILVARKDSPLIIGIGNGENFVCSDLNALLFYTQRFIELENGEMALIKHDSVKIYNIETGEEVIKPIKEVDIHPDTGDKGDYEHYMLKEIFEQPDVYRRILENYLGAETSPMKDSLIKQRTESTINFSSTQRILIQACGTSWHSGLVAKYWIEHFSRTLTEVDISSELRYRTLLSNENDVILAISQSGETADTLACIREAKSQFLKVLSFLNVEKSTIDRESDAIVYSHSGKEVGVASTKNYLAQLATLYLFSIFLGQVKGQLTQEQATTKVEEFKLIPALIEKILTQKDKIKAIAEKYSQQSSFIFIGRGVNYPTALEGALKLKEISYLHATGYAAGELKHGPLALIDENLPVICIVPQSPIYPKMISNIQEVKARKGRIIAIATEGDQEIDQIAEDVLFIPAVSEELSPLLTIIPLQLFSYYLAVKLGSDVDQPKNLAKSVTVE